MVGLLTEHRQIWQVFGQYQSAYGGRELPHGKQLLPLIFWNVQRSRQYLHILVRGVSHQACLGDTRHLPLLFSILLYRQNFDFILGNKPNSFGNSGCIWAIYPRYISKISSRDFGKTAGFVLEIVGSF